jgi:Flavoprotein
MTASGKGRVMYVIVSSAGPAGHVGHLVQLAQDQGWAVQIIATPPALSFIDVLKLEAQTGRPVRSQYRSPGEPRSPKADAIIVAPATYNTINKWANGISDNYALGILAEAPGLGVPVVVLPFVNSALASRPPFRDSIAKLRAEGVRILLGPGQFEPHPPGTGGEQIDTFPWALALTELNQLARAQRPHGPRRSTSEETGS